jgi:hypothetical protein
MYSRYDFITPIGFLKIWPDMCFADWPDGFSVDYELRKFFDAARLVPGIELAYDFKDGPGPWIVVCRLEKGSTWKGPLRRSMSFCFAVVYSKMYWLRLCSSSRFRLEVQPD